MARQRLFVGFSTIDATPGNYKLFDIDLVKRDLMNHFMTRRGERVMLPNYGTIIWDMLFEPFDEFVKNQVIEDVERIASYDPRLELKNVQVSSTDHGLTIELLLEFRPYDVVGTFTFDFVRRISGEEQEI